ncbi:MULTISPECIES: dTDP-glucose 4,6-dehydratase [Nocardiopsidaceae]|uniref:dTDP-glucose 4,6-dehydratase n=2 Tax=Nocardiopsidaceae TaxID=83676 RepID=A0ABY6YMH9_9ACTN|nr:dTDP-glucose 4,6-dehydratase [Streptomonospora nanhaiensis]MEE2042965.1 dTDP-glucose 4,6-dehydratase [Nocardiopsis tropica]WAE73434.1 dTDP-glucose 4,6-dehydratase [Streptomonospora nanhaiensis]
MKILVTGGAGFIGSNFVRRVLAGSYPRYADAEIVVLDKLTYAGTTESLASVADDPRLTFVRGDVCDEQLVRELMGGVSLVVHCAAETHVDRSISDAGCFVRTNVMGTFHLLDSALAENVENFVLVSTDEVYGTLGSGSWVETDPLEPNSPYSASKSASDLLARSFHRTYGMRVCVTRCANNYGPFQFPEKMIPLFVTNLLDGTPVPVYGDGGNVREWVHVDDHCDALALAAEHGEPGEVYNIGGSVEKRNLEVTDALLELLGHDASMVRFVADRKGHDRRYSVDGTKAAERLGYRPAVSFEEGLARTVAWYTENRAWWEPLKKRLSQAEDGG